jgi:hypothetical protein
VVLFDKVTHIETSGKVDLVNKNYSSEFQTDAAIKKHGDMSHLAGRNLQSVDSSWLAASGDMSLDSKGGKNWDQFEVNKRLFNVKDTYDENLYTKKLDLKSMTAAQIANAERLAREIEGTASGNIHLQEERGQITQGDWDEEDRFSGVLREEDRNKKPPSKSGADAGNAWARGARLGGSNTTSGAASPSTVANTKDTPAAASSGSSKSNKPAVSPPPGVTMPASGQATNSPSPKKERSSTPAAGVAADTKSATDTTAKTTAKNAAPKGEEAAAKPSAETTAPAASSSAVATPREAPAASLSKDAPADNATTSSSATTAEAPKDEAVKAAPKLRANAVEFKPSWMKDTAPAPAPTQPPMAQPLPQFVPPMYATMPYGVPPMTPEGPQFIPAGVHNSPGPQGMMVGSPSIGGMPGEMLPQQFYAESHMQMMPPPVQQPQFDPYNPPQQFMYAPQPAPGGQMQMGIPMMVDYSQQMMQMPPGAVMMPPYGQAPHEFYQMMPGQPMMQFPGGGMYPQNMPMQGGPGMYSPQGMGGPPYMQPGANMGSGQKMGGMR